jgi:hypothetical protein
MKKLSFVLVLTLWFRLEALIQGAELTLKVIDKEPPKEFDTSIRAALQSKAVQLLDGEKPLYEFWFVSELPLQSKPASLNKALDSIKQTTLLGGVWLGASLRDYRDDEMSAGLYTVRFGLQPQDGDHLGTAEYRYFALLVPARIDTSLGGIDKYNALTKASSKEASNGHPLVLSLRPASSTQGSLPALGKPSADHRTVRVSLPGKVAGGEKVDLIFDLVYQGQYKH